MFRAQRRKKNETDLNTAKLLLKNERRGVLSVIGDNGYPYAVPLNYIYDEEENRIYFHGSKVGHKIDAIRKCEKVCFTVFGDEEKGEPEWAPYMKSTIVFGRCHLVESKERTLKLVKKLALKYYPDEAEVDSVILEEGHGVQMFEIEIEHMSGKRVQER